MRLNHRLSMPKVAYLQLWPYDMSRRNCGQSTVERSKYFQVTNTKLRHIKSMNETVRYEQYLVVYFTLSTGVCYTLVYYNISAFTTFTCVFYINSFIKCMSIKKSIVDYDHRQQNITDFRSPSLVVITVIVFRKDIWIIVLTRNIKSILLTWSWIFFRCYCNCVFEREDLT